MNQIKFQNLSKENKSSYGESAVSEYPVGFIPRKSGTYRIEINTAIENVSQFSTAIQVLGMATEEDDVEIHIQCPGGNVDASGAFLHALRKCRAPVHMCASGGCHSAATHILLEGDSFELADNFNSLIHNGYSGSVGNLNEYHAKSDFDKKFLYEQYRGIYEGFLSPQEFDGVMRGDQIWLDGDGWMTRAQARSDYFKAKYEAAQKPQRKNRKKKAVDVPQEA